METLAYHLVWTTYGTWLPGDARGWVRWGEGGVLPVDRTLEQESRARMAESPVILSESQRALVEHTIGAHCRLRGWFLHAASARSNHVHVVVSADRAARTVRDQFKAWCSRRLSDAAGLETAMAKGGGRRRWFTEGGAERTIDTEEYLANAIQYVLEGQ